MSGQFSQKEMFNRLDDIIKEELMKHPPGTWSLKWGSSHIKIYVGSMFVGIHTGHRARSKNTDNKVPLAVRSQIRRAYAGVASITGARVAPADGDRHGRREARAS